MLTEQKTKNTAQNNTRDRPNTEEEEVKKTNCTRGNGLNQFVINLLVVICNKIQTNDRANRFATLHFDILEPHHSPGQSQHEQTATIKKNIAIAFRLRINY